MGKYLLVMALLLCTTQFFYAQEDGVASLAIPVRNSLKFNRYIINPTFSFVREQNKHISLNNKREWTQFDNAPQTYLLSYSGRFRENIGLGIGLFQQNYGVLTSYGGIINMAYNAMLKPDSNLTFGLNIGFYQSGINEGKIVTNVADPSLENIPKSSLLSISPGINYGTVFFDFGISVNNLVQYNFNTSELLKEDPQQNIQAHIMYTGYMSSRGFFDESKFSGLVKSEFKKDKTIISGLAMLSVPKGIWGQIGYSTQYGVSGGIGLNITTQIAIEYNYEKAMGDFSAFGSSHDITLAYKFKNTNSFYYSGDDEEESMIIPETKKRRRVTNKPKVDAETRARLAKERAETRALAQAKAEEEARLAEEALAQAKAEEEARLAEEALAQAKAEEEARLAEEALAQAKAEEEARLAEEALAQAKAEEEARLAEEALAQAKAEEEARLAEETLAQAKAEEEARLAEEALAQAKAEEEARLAEEALAQAKAEEEARLAEEALAQAKAEEEARLAEEALAQAKAEEEARLAEEALAQARAEEEARLAEEALVQAKAEEEAQLEITHKDNIAKSMFEITQSTKTSKIEQEELLLRLNEAVTNKDKDLKDLKEENDLSEQGIYLEPKPFKSISAENKAIELLKTEVDEVIKSRNEKIKELENLYSQRLKKVSNKNEKTNQYYLETIQNLKEEQIQTERAKASLVSALETIRIATEFERKRRIKRAAYDNENDRNLKDKAALNRIKANTPLSKEPLKPEDFDFGEEQSSNVQILKGVQNVDNGYYIIIAVHSDKDKRDDFLEKVVSTGQSNINFFFDVNTSKYFIYYERFDYVEGALKALESKGSKPYNGKMSIVKIEN